jgi:hypothetical protein
MLTPPTNHLICAYFLTKPTSRCLTTVPIERGLAFYRCDARVRCQSRCVPETAILSKSLIDMLAHARVHPVFTGSAD